MSGIILVGFCVPVSAALRDFIPKIWNYSAELDVDVVSDTDETEFDSGSTKTQDNYAREVVSFWLNGYVYHKRFIRYYLGLSAGLNQENITINDEDSGWRTGSGTGYDFRAVILPEHPYKLILFTRRLEPLTRPGISALGDQVTYSKGASFRYKQKPYFVNLDYVNTTNETGPNSYENSVYSGNGTYYKQYRDGGLLRLTGSYLHRETSSSSGFKGSDDDAAFLNTIVYKRHTLSSSVSSTSFEQKKDLAVSGKTFTWMENLHLTLPWNLSAGLGYGFTKAEANFDTPSSSGNSDSTGNNYILDLTHRLYDSLVTRYTFRLQDASSTVGSSNATSNVLSVNYAKNIPGGRLYAGFSYAQVDSTFKGALDISFESHAVDFPLSGPVPSPVPEGDFRLNHLDVDPATLTLFVRNPDPPFDLLVMRENIDYTATVINRVMYIDIIGLPLVHPLFPLNYAFLASYSLLNRDTTLKTTSTSYTISADLFSNLLNPYYSHFTTETSGNLGIEPFSQTTDTVGINVTKLPFTFSTSYTNVQSTGTPYKLWRNDLTYRETFEDETEVNASAYYSTINYPQGTSGSGQGYTDKLSGVAAGIQKRYLNRLLTVALGGSYSRTRGLSNSNVYTGNGYLSWNVNRLQVVAGASVSSSDVTSGSTHYRRLVEHFWLRIKRKLF